MYSLFRKKIMEAEHIEFHFKINDIQLNLGDSFNKKN